MAASPVVRTTFFEEQARHRRRTLRFALFGASAVALAGIPVSLMVTPVLYLVVLTVAHLIDLATPVSPAFWDLVNAAGRLIPAALDPIDQGLNHDDWSHLDWLALGRLGLVLVAPGMVLMLLLWIWVRALFWHAGTGGVLLSIGARDPRPGDLEERQLVNLIGEMAIAAGIRQPAVKLLDQTAPNAVAVGSTPDDATIVVTRGLLDTLDRDETQAVLGHLIGSVVNGDLKIAMLLLSVNQTYGLLGSILTAGSARKSRQALWGAVRGLFIRDDRADRQVADLLASEPDIEDKAREGCLTAIRIPFMLAAATTTFLISMGQLLFFGPPLAALWRARRFLADATSVKLTRNPDGMAHALQKMGRADTDFALARSSGLLFVHWTHRVGEAGPSQPVGGWHPSIAKRLGRLQAVGARLITSGATGAPARRANPLGQALVGLLLLFVWALFGVGLVAMVAGGLLMMFISLLFVGVALFAIHGFFTILPGLIHWFRFDAVPLAKAIYGTISRMIQQASR